MKIIFLDIDGVLTSARTGWSNMDPFAVTFLKLICEQCDIKIDENVFTIRFLYELTPNKKIFG